MVPTCPLENTEDIENGSFWNSRNLNWETHRIGWAVAGGCAGLTILISLVSVWQHCRNYNKPSQQRQALRILYLPPIYALVSFLSYRFFRDYTYYNLAGAVYESITLSAFVLLLIELVADTAIGHNALKAIERKDKRTLPAPLCCWRYRPKAYFMHTAKWGVLQYVIIQPACSIAGIICEVFKVLCVRGPYSVHYASVYLKVIRFISTSLAVYGMRVFCELTKEELQGRRPRAKFWSIKLLFLLTSCQSLALGALQGTVFKATQYWTAFNIANGLNALAVCIEMVFFSVWIMWAYTWNEYKIEGAPRTSIWRPLWDSINFMDFAVEIYASLKFFVDYAHGKPRANPVIPRKRASFAQAFGIDDGSQAVGAVSASESPVHQGTHYDELEGIRLLPHPYSNPSDADGGNPTVQEGHGSVQDDSLGH